MLFDGGRFSLLFTNILCSLAFFLRFSFFVDNPVVLLFQSVSSILVSMELLSLMSRDLATLFLFQYLSDTWGFLGGVLLSVASDSTVGTPTFHTCTASLFRRSLFVERFASPAPTVGGDEVGADPDDTWMATGQNNLFVELMMTSTLKASGSCGHMDKAGTCVA